MEQLNKTPFLNKILALFTSIISIILILFYSTFIRLLTSFTEKNIRTYDGIIEDNQIFILEITLVFFILMGFLISIILSFNLGKKFIGFVNTTFDTKRLKTTFFTDSLTSKPYHTKKVFMFATLFAILWHLKFLLFGDTPEKELYKETLIEHTSSLLFFISSILLIISIIITNHSLASKKDKKIIKRWLILCSISLLIIFFEEISWGQQYFNWETTGVFKENNFQSETNFHNFINPFFRFIYPLMGMGLFITLFLIWFYYKEKKPYWLELITPHQSLFILTFLMACTSFIGQSETFEEMLSIFVLLYSIRIFICLLHPSKLV